MDRIKTPRYRRVFKTNLVLKLIFQASNESQPDEVTTESSEWKVVGFANRTILPPKILNFCDPFPIFEAEKEEASVESQESGKKIYQ